MARRSIVGIVLAVATWLPFATASANYPYQTPNFGVTQCYTCHNNASGGGGCSSPPCLIQFGLDFQANGRVWNYWLAIKDSDGDGFSNGRELMDPYGYWRPGYAEPGQSGYVTYPGWTTYSMSECSINVVNVSGPSSYSYDYALCAPNASCYETSGANYGYGCTCPSGYTAGGAPSGQTCTDVDECTPGRCGVGSCTNYPGSFTCNCPGGYAFNGNTCAQDACAMNVDNCMSGTTCNPDPNNSSNWWCSCSPGYVTLQYTCGTFSCGYVCSNYDECTNNNPACPSTSACVDTVGSHTCTPCGANAHVVGAVNAESCVCNAGFSGDPYSSCVDTDECLAETDDCAEEGSFCENTPGSFVCHCIPGFTGNGKVCTDVDECATNVDECAGVSVCQNLPGGYTCDCGPGRLGDGRFCRDIDECATNGGGCGEGFRCVNSDGSFACVCAPGYVSDGAGGCVGGCGNGAVLPPEGCDDGNTAAGDGCDSNCRIERTYACSEDSAGKSSCVATCGNEFIEPPGEECDLGAASNSDTLPNTCRTNCRLPRCGDGTLDDGETCDDGLANSATAANACRTSCRPAFCGDGVVDTAEACDPGGFEVLDATACSEADCRAAESPGDGGSDGGCSCSTTSSAGAGGRSALVVGLVFAVLGLRRRRARS